jgi:hypothetical protein
MRRTPIRSAARAVSTSGKTISPVEGAAAESVTVRVKG